MRIRVRRIVPYLAIFTLGLGTVACGGGDDIDSNEEARRAYLGLDGSIEKSLNLGFDGFNAASSANIAPQMDVGTATGTLTISGQADQGSSDNKGFRLNIDMVEYSDGVFTVVVNESDEVEVDLTYDTDRDVSLQPYLMMQLRNFPNGTLYGELTGVYYTSGDMDVDVTLDLQMDGAIMDGGNGDVLRVPGTTHVYGTATSGDGLYDVDITI